jgi:hypothetical protein
MLKDIDWQSVVFVGISLLNEYLPTIHNYHLPKVYYWNGDRDSHKRL